MEHRAGILDIGLDALRIILGNLCARDLVQTSAVCRMFYELCNENDFWKTLCGRHGVDLKQTFQKCRRLDWKTIYKEKNWLKFDETKVHQGLFLTNACKTIIARKTINYRAGAQLQYCVPPQGTYLIEARVRCAQNAVMDFAMGFANQLFKPGDGFWNQNCGLLTH